MIFFENYNFVVMVYGFLMLLVGFILDIIWICLVSYDLVIIFSELKEWVIKVMIIFVICLVVVCFIIIIFVYFLFEVGIFVYLVILFFMFWCCFRVGKYYVKKGIEVLFYIKFFI